MPDRYAATFDSDRPHLGVVIDQQRDRYCTFPSPERAQRAADHWNQPPLWDHDPPMVWRSVRTGNPIGCRPEAGHEGMHMDSGEGGDFEWKLSPRPWPTDLVNGSHDA